MKYKNICPSCFAETAHSVVMEEKNGVWQCSKNPRHKFTRDDQGFYKKAG